MIWRRATKGWLFLLVPLLALWAIFPYRSLATQADAPQFTLQVCRSHVKPCQHQVSIPEGEIVGMDLVLSDPDFDDGNDPPAVAAWETHFRLSDSSLVELVPDDWNRPVREQGDLGLALGGLGILQAGSEEDRGQFFSLQNQFDADSGSLDYAVTLVRFNQTKVDPRVPPFSIKAPLHLGRIMLKGVSTGSAAVSLADSPGGTSQVVALDQTGGLTAIAVKPVSTPQAIIKVGNVTTPWLEGLIVATGSVSSPRAPTVLTVAFWPPGAIPSWQGGNGVPVASFSKVATDAAGAFRITDIAPSVAPPGVYDLRIAGRGTLPALVSGVTVLASGGPSGPPPTTAIGTVSLRDGDIDGNNSIDIGDVDALIAAFGRLESETEFNPNADFNGDAVVDVVDFVLLAENFGGIGD